MDEKHAALESLGSNTQAQQVYDAMTAAGFHGWASGGGCDFYRQARPADGGQGIRLDWVRAFLTSKGKTIPLGRIEDVTVAEDEDQIPSSMDAPVELTVTTEGCNFVSVPTTVQEIAAFDPGPLMTEEEMCVALEGLGFEYNPQTGGGCTAFVAYEGDCKDPDKLRRLLTSKGVKMFPDVPFELWITREGDPCAPECSTEPVEFGVVINEGQEDFASFITTVAEILNA